MNTATVGVAVTPTVLSTFLNHYFNRKPLRQRPTAHLSYDEGLHLVRSFLDFASHHTVEDLQAFTSQWVPHPVWVTVDDVEIPQNKVDEAATKLQEQLGPDGIKQVGGTKWWQWRRPESQLAAEWIEMRADYNERQKSGDVGKRVMFYVHGGAYFFGSVDVHRYQLQRHARKLKARVFAPRYRLAPQFPFPCGLQDCLAAYLYLLTVQDPAHIILAGDSAGGGMVLSLLVILRDRGIPLPAGAVLISPWVDLTHSFPSVAGEAPLDYIPSNGFHFKPSKAWPPLNPDEHALLREQIAKNTTPGHTKLMKPASVDMKGRSHDASRPESAPRPGSAKPADRSANVENYNSPPPLSIELDGTTVYLKDQIQLYTTNELLSHPLVSPVTQPTLGGLPPLLIMVGGGEILRDEQIYVAHKCADPAKYAPPESSMNESDKAKLASFPPTDVQLQVWDDLCHVAPTLSFTRPAKFMYRSVAQFGAWALARAQNTEIDILFDDAISMISDSSSNNGSSGRLSRRNPERQDSLHTPAVGKAGDELPPFKDHMIRQQVSRHGTITSLAPECDLIACNIDFSQVGVIKEVPVRKWLLTRAQWDNRFGSARAKIHKRRLKEMMAGYEQFDGETPPPSALASRRKMGDELANAKKSKSYALSLWSLWGSKHDESTMHREREADKAPLQAAAQEPGSDITERQVAVNGSTASVNPSPSHRRFVKDANQIPQETPGTEEATPLDSLMAKRTAGHQPTNSVSTGNTDLLSPNDIPETGAAGKRPMVDGIAVPFTLNNEAETASMITLMSNNGGQLSRVASPRPLSLEGESIVAGSTLQTPRPSSPSVPVLDDMADEEPVTAGTPRSAGHGATPTTEKPDGLNEKTPAVIIGDGNIDFAAAAHEKRPPLETFVTAQEHIPKAN